VLSPDEVLTVDLADSKRIWALVGQLEFEYTLAAVDPAQEAELSFRVVGQLPGGANPGAPVPERG
jgi:hypothetical protein